MHIYGAKLINILCNVYVFELLLNIVTAQTNEFTLTVLHVNDFHAHFEETNTNSGRCTEKDSEENNCFGGFPRLYTKVEELRKSMPNVIFLSAGDYYQGTLWYSLHKWKPAAQFLNLIYQDAMSVGNHEFDDGIAGLVPFLNNVSFPVLAANIDASEEPSIQGLIHPSVILNKGGRKIGIIGYVTPETKILSYTGKIIFLDEIESISKEAKRLKQEGINIIIALGHSGFRKDLEIAKNVNDVDIVVGGHTNTFLYTGKDPSTEKSAGDYPTVVTQDSGRKVPVVQAYAFGKYLGFLQVVFDTNGEIMRWNGNPILLDSTVGQDPEILSELIPWKQKIVAYARKVVGQTYVFLDGKRQTCRMEECNMGNLIADGFVYQNLKYPDDMRWSRAGLAIMNSGGIRSSIDEITTKGNITMEDISAVAPFGNTIDIVTLKGKHVREMFEHSVAKYDPEGLDPPGAFLQVSGFYVEYDISKPSGSRVVKLKARCTKCRVPIMEEVISDKIYEIAAPNYIIQKGDGFSVIKNNKINHYQQGFLDIDVFVKYVQAMSPIHQGKENRIIFISPDNGNCSTKTYSDGQINNQPVTSGILHNTQDLRRLLSIIAINIFVIKNILY